MGGGGGSSFAAPDASDVDGFTDNTGDGQVTITFDPSTDACPEPPPGPDGDGGDGADGAAACGAPVAVVSQPRFTG
jgi:hypothetical protein